METEINMKKLLGVWCMCALFFMAGCTRKEEAAAVVREAACKEAEIIFTLNDLWTEHEEKQAGEGQMLVFSASEEKTGAGIDIWCEDLSKTQGGTLVRLEDYVSGILEKLKQAEENGDYCYLCSDAQTEEVYGKEYISFQVQVPEMDASQKFYIRRQEDMMTVMIISAFGEEKIEDILSLGKEM